MIAIALAEGKGFPEDYWPAGSISSQVKAQGSCLILTLTISCFAGLTGGFIAGLPCFQPPHALFRDDDHFFEMQDKYPKSYLRDCDESYAAAKANFDQIK